MRDLTVNTPGGVINVIEGPDQDNPSVVVQLNGDDKIVVEWNSEKGKFGLFAWKDNEGEDPVVRHFWDSEDEAAPDEAEGFYYRGLVFRPVQSLPNKDSDFFKITRRISNIGVTPDGWNYNEFYEVAKQNNAGEIDLFEVNGISVIPGKNYLFRYK